MPLAHLGFQAGSGELSWLRPTQIQDRQRGAEFWTGQVESRGF